MNYDIHFWDKMLRLNSSTAEQICKIRWDFVTQHTEPKVVLDYGSGVGWFRAFRPDGIEVDTYDIGQYPQTGVRHEHYDIMTLWDVLEHLPNLKEIEPYLNIVSHVAASLPIVRETTDLKTWKHFKPKEHLHYYTEEVLDIVFEEYGFVKIVSAEPECPPREDIKDFIYQKRQL